MICKGSRDSGVTYPKVLGSRLISKSCAISHQEIMRMGGVWCHFQGGESAVKKWSRSVPNNSCNLQQKLMQVPHDDIIAQARDQEVHAGYTAATIPGNRYRRASHAHSGDGPCELLRSR